MKKIAIFTATGFGLGFSPIAPGTSGSLLGVALTVAMASLPSPVWVWQAGLTVVLSLLAIPICTAAESHFGKHDDRRIVADEYLTYPLCMLAIPWAQYPWMLATGFVVNRVMDIVKIPPAYQAQKLPRGAGIVADDFISCLYALAINHAILAGVRHFL